MEKTRILLQNVPLENVEELNSLRLFAFSIETLALKVSTFSLFILLSTHFTHIKLYTLLLNKHKDSKMKKFLTIASILTIGLFFTACGGSSDKQGFSKSGKAGSLAVTYSSSKPLVVGDNTIDVKIMNHGKALTGAKVDFKIFMPEMPGMPYMEEVKTLKENGGSYSGNINLSMSGTWQVKIFVEKDGKKYKHSSSVIL